VTADVETEHGIYEVDLETEEVTGLSPGSVDPEPPVETGLPKVMATAAAGATVVAVVNRRPPLVVSYDTGRTWREAGGGLPAGRAVSISAENPDLILFGSRNRLYVSEDGGRFWRALAPELPEIRALRLRS
jgi:hypothetical protein